MVRAERDGENPKSENLKCIPNRNKHSARPISGRLFSGAWRRLASTGEGVTSYNERAG